MPKEYTRRVPLNHPIARFLVHAGQTDDCWPWQGRINRKGYGQMLVDGKWPSVHRWIYEFCYGPLADDLVIDHTCHNRDASCPAGPACLHRRCCNPAHLEAVTVGENIRRGQTGKANNYQHAKVACKRGHPFTMENTYVSPADGSRQCKICSRANAARYRAEGRYRTSVLKEISKSTE